jgi:hypothetical protein
MRTTPKDSGLSVNICEGESNCPGCDHRLIVRQTWFPTCTYEPRAYLVGECTRCDYVGKATPARKANRTPMPREDS